MLRFYRVVLFENHVYNVIGYYLSRPFACSVFLRAAKQAQAGSKLLLQSVDVGIDDYAISPLLSLNASDFAST